MNYRKDPDLIDLVRAIIKKWWLILIFTTIGFFGAYFMTVNFIPPLYEAKATLFIGNENTDLGSVDISLGQINADSQLIIDYQQIALTHLVIDEVIKNLNLKISYNEFRNHVYISTVQDSRLFTVGFIYPNPRTATLISNELAKQLTTAVYEIVGVENIRILDPAQLPEYPISPNLLSNTLFGSFVGCVSSLMVILILFFLDDTIKTEDEIEKLLGSTVLGAIPQIKENPS